MIVLTPILTGQRYRALLPGDRHHPAYLIELLHNNCAPLSFLTVAALLVQLNLAGPTRMTACRLRLPPRLRLTPCWLQRLSFVCCGVATRCYRAPPCHPACAEPIPHRNRTAMASTMPFSCSCCSCWRGGHLCQAVPVMSCPALRRSAGRGHPVCTLHLRLLTLSRTRL